MVQPMYAVAIRDAISSGELSKMETAAEQAKQQLREQDDLRAALQELESSITKLKSKK